MESFIFEHKVGKRKVHFSFPEVSVQKFLLDPSTVLDSNFSKNDFFDS